MGFAFSLAHFLLNFHKYVLALWKWNDGIFSYRTSAKRPNGGIMKNFFLFFHSFFIFSEWEIKLNVILLCECDILMWNSKEKKKSMELVTNGFANCCSDYRCKSCEQQLIFIEKLFFFLKGNGILATPTKNAQRYIRRALMNCWWCRSNISLQNRTWMSYFNDVKLRAAKKVITMRTKV